MTFCCSRNLMELRVRSYFERWRWNICSCNIVCITGDDILMAFGDFGIAFLDWEEYKTVVWGKPTLANNNYQKRPKKKTCQVLRLLCQHKRLALRKTPALNTPLMFDGDDEAKTVWIQERGLSSPKYQICSREWRCTSEHGQSLNHLTAVHYRIDQSPQESVRSGVTHLHSFSISHT